VLDNTTVYWNKKIHTFTIWKRTQFQDKFFSDFGNFQQYFEIKINPKISIHNIHNILAMTSLSYDCEM